MFSPSMVVTFPKHLKPKTTKRTDSYSQWADYSQEACQSERFINFSSRRFYQHCKYLQSDTPETKESPVKAFMPRICPSNSHLVGRANWITPHTHHTRDPVAGQLPIMQPLNEIHDAMNAHP